MGLMTVEITGMKGKRCALSINAQRASSVVLVVVAVFHVTGIVMVKMIAVITVMNHPAVKQKRSLVALNTLFVTTVRSKLVVINSLQFIIHINSAFPFTVLNYP